MVSRAPARLALGPGKEFDAIRAFVTGDALPRGVSLGPGDDAAVLEGGWVVSTDASVEGIHFRRSWMTDQEVGYRATAAALSDLSAMGARPVAVLVSVAVPRSRFSLADLQRGVRLAAGSAGAAVIGGDVSSSPGTVFVDVTVLGRAESPVLRSAARPGHELWVSGTLGAAAAAVRVWEAGDTGTDRLRERFVHPPDRSSLGQELATLEGLGAMIDLSDGVAGDAGHVATGSGVRLVVEVAALPVADEARAVLSDAAAAASALYGGEDYELMFTAEPGAFDPIALSHRHGVALTRVGRVSTGGGVWLEDETGDLTAIQAGGYDHLEDRG